MSPDSPPKPETPTHRPDYDAAVSRYKKLRQDYKQLGREVVELLKRKCRELGVLAMVTSRAKTLVSFAEKIHRPGKHYADPLGEITDLCGVRVIVHTLRDVLRVGEAIKAEKSFRVVPQHSEDKRDRLLQDDRFGYLSVHYVVARPVGSGEQYAEIQVRTILQHAWADIQHEVSYKKGFNLPPDLKREYGRLAAILEAADETFQRLRNELDRYATDPSAPDSFAYLDEKDLKEELGRQEILHRVSPKDAQVAHRLAQLAMSLGRWSQAAEVLTPFADEHRGPLLRDLGISLCKMNRRDPDGQAFQKGQGYLKKSTELNPGDVDAWASLGGTWRTCEDAAAAAGDAKGAAEYRDRAKKCYHRAWEIRPAHAYSLGNYLEYLLADRPDLDVLSFFRPSLAEAGAHCEWQIRAGLNLPWALFDLGKFELMLGHAHPALRWYARGVFRSTRADHVDSALKSFAKLAAARKSLPGFDWSEGLLDLASRCTCDRWAPPAADPAAARLTGPVVIVAGSCGGPAPQGHRQLLRDALRGFRGTVIAGGTTDGVSGVVGELQGENPDLHTVGYLPAKTPGTTVDRRYQAHRHSDGQDFSPLEALLYWRDLLAAGNRPGSVRLLALGGGEVTWSECEVALALGAQVGVIDPPPADAVAAEPFWEKKPPVLHRLPAEAGAVREFLGLR
jgi:ppGpp synthetase/RelA/SpoT-type nucleotidyltranferase